VDLVRGKEVLLEESLKQDAAHFSGAEDSDVEIGDLRGGLRGLNGYLSHGVPFVVTGCGSDLRINAEASMLDGF
jgi:hypothetical protein